MYPPLTQIRNLILLLGDQLSLPMSSLSGADPERDVVMMCEVMEEATYVSHHRMKLAFVFSAMRHFAEEVKLAGFRLRYTRLEDEENAGSFSGEVALAVEALKPERLIVTEPGEWRVLSAMRSWSDRFGIPVEVRPDWRFLCSHRDFRAWAAKRQGLLMEHFYRDMRRRTGYLMDGPEPAGGRWNFDAANRKPAKPDLLRPRHLQFEPDAVTAEVIAMVERRFPDNIGRVRPFFYAVRREDALKALAHFVKEFLPRFGETQDAMLSGDPFLNHSLLSMYINIGLLDPREVCEAAETAFRAGRVPVNAAEGFIRQIIGWREYMRGVYWLKMPDYAESNHFGNTRPLPGFFWTGETDMNCLSTVIGETLDHAYAHHIQRLMITGNFALLAGIDPADVHRWYLEVYADAYEWVEMPNVIGMSQFADGGVVATKPYAASGNYINRMSDYCSGCRYSVTKKTGPDSCPFNSLYWDFLDRNREKLRANHRLAQPYATWGRMSEEQRQTYRETAANFLARLT